jgi:GNAT superfamily N-acetyltransferase
MSSDDVLIWRPATADEVPLLAAMNAELSRDEGATPVGSLADYEERLHTWLETGRYRAALARRGDQTIAYVVWRDDPDYADVFVRQFFVVREHRGQGLGRRLFAQAVDEFWPGRLLRLDVYDSNPRGGAFWESLGFVPFSRLMRREPASVDDDHDG